MKNEIIVNGKPYLVINSWTNERAGDIAANDLICWVGELSSVSKAEKLSLRRELIGAFKLVNSPVLVGGLEIYLSYRKEAV